MNQSIPWMITCMLALLIGCSISCYDRSMPEDLDRAVRGDTSNSTWNSLPGTVKFERCLRYKISEMREMVSVVNDPSDLVRYYPDWAESLDECAMIYPTEQNRAELLSERVASEMAKVLGEETEGYLFSVRLHQDQDPAGEWVDYWRITAIVGIASVSDVLEDPEEP